MKLVVRYGGLGALLLLMFLLVFIWGAMFGTFLREVWEVLMIE